MALLEGKEDWKPIFHRSWKTTYSNSKAIDIFDHPDIVYSHGDFDADILQEQDLIIMKQWISELNLSYLGTEPIEVYKECAKIKKNPFKTTTSDILKYFNRCSWISLSRKGDILLNSFSEQFYPRIEKVIATQKQVSIKDETTGDSIVGVIDFVVKLKGEELPVIFDLKTAHQPYEAEAVEISDQLTLYAALAGNTYNTNKVGYCVLTKAIPKNTIATCKSCGYTRNGRHQTCNNVVSDKRCGGEWLEKKVPVPEVQVIIETKTQEQSYSLLEDLSKIILAAKNDIHVKNTNTCLNYFGQKCPAYNYCWKGSKEGLKEKGT